MTACRRFALLACAASSLVFLAGCGAEEPKPAEPVEFEETLGFSGEGIIERQGRVEGEIRDCMREQGFDYVPVDPLVQERALTGQALTEEEFIKQFGDGVSTLFDRGLGGGRQTDPNERIRDALSPADRTAYDRALGGDNPAMTFAEAVDSGDFSELGGCAKQASEAEFGGAAVVTALIGKLDELDEAIVQDQRMVRAAEKWSACLAEQGFRYADPDDIEEDLTERFQAIVGSDVAAGATTAPPGLSYDRAALAELQREEVRLGAVDLECENRELDPVERVVRPEYEAIFRKTNRRLIARVRPAAEG